MKEVQIFKVGCHTRWMTAWPGEMEEILRGDQHQTDVIKVRYDTGQLCTFKRKARSTKDNE